MPTWLRDAVPFAIALLLAAALYLLRQPEWSLAVLALTLIAAFAYNQWMLARLTSWAALPSRRDLTRRGVSGASWSEAFERLSRGYNTLKSESDALRTELHSVHTAVDKIEDALVVLDKYSHIEWSNQQAQELFGFIGSAGLHRPIHHFLRDPRFSDLLDNQFHAKAGHVQTMQISLHNRPGAIFQLQLISGEHGQQLLIARDITRQAKLDAVKSDFIANISHEIRTPLTVVSGYTETLLDLDLEKGEQRKHLETIRKQSQTMQNLVADLLTLSSLEHSIDDKTETNVDVTRLFADIEQEARALSAGQHLIQFKVEHPASIRCSADEFASAVRNLVSNAIRYTPKGGQVNVSFKFDHRVGRISVEDSGVGIAPEHIPRLTERFYRVDRGRSRGSGGTGLGLAIVKRIANRHQMELEIKSRVGEGSTFSLVIPAGRILFPQSDASRQLALA